MAVYLGNTYMGSAYIGNTPIQSAEMKFGKDLIPRNGLVQWLDAANPTSYPGSGSVWYDVSGNGYNAAPLVGNSSFPTWNSSTNDFTFVTSPGTAVRSTSPTLSTMTQIVWCSLQGLSIGRGGGAYGIENTSGQNFDSIVWAETTALRWQNGSANADRQVVSTTNETSTAYSMMTIVKNATTNLYTLYQNGNVLASTNYVVPTFPSASSVLNVGWRFNGGGGNQFYAGNIAMCLTYDRVLTQSEIQQIYSIGR